MPFAEYRAKLKQISHVLLWKQWNDQLIWHLLKCQILYPFLNQSCLLNKEILNRSSKTEQVETPECIKTSRPTTKAVNRQSISRLFRGFGEGKVNFFQWLHMHLQVSQVPFWVSFQCEFVCVRESLSVFTQICLLCAFHLRLSCTGTAASEMAGWALFSLQSNCFPTARPARHKPKSANAGLKAGLNRTAWQTDRRGAKERGRERPVGERPRGLFLSLVQCDETGRRPIRHDNEPTGE